jgi:hypothetical protein
MARVSRVIASSERPVRLGLCSLQKRENRRFVPVPFCDGGCRQAAALEFLAATARAGIVPAGAYAHNRRLLSQSETPYGWVGSRLRRRPGYYIRVYPSPLWGISLC